jgi:DNA helicase HerA-like ATPase
LLAPDIPLALDAGGLDRHTFLCGQSGSGKTYALGALLEQVVLETGLRIVVLDPNSDFARFALPRADASAAEAKRWSRAAAGVVVRQAAENGEERLRLRFADLDTPTRAAVLRLDPIRDREEYAMLAAVLARAREGAGLAALHALASADDATEQRLALRVANLGVQEWRVWAREDRGAVLEELLARDSRCLVVDLGSLPTREEQALTAAAVLGTLWEHRTDRAPTLIVVDEAHNVCPQHPEDGLTALATEHAVRIAGEGRKFGLHLLVATQRPQKVHENVVSQCDNLLLMRMNSTADVAAIADRFSFVPRGLLERATAFRQGECLVAGKLPGHPALVRVGRRLAEEGGSDAPSDWAEARR